MNVFFTRHKLSESQLAGIDGPIDLDMSDLASKNILTLDDAEDVYQDILARILAQSRETLCGKPVGVLLYGVIPCPLRWAMNKDCGLHDEDDRVAAYYAQCVSSRLVVMEAFNVQRSQEGGKPTFEFAGWLRTGHYVSKKLSEALEIRWKDEE